MDPIKVHEEAKRLLLSALKSESDGHSAQALSDASRAVELLRRVQ